MHKAARSQSPICGDPEDEVSFLRRVYIRGGELTLQGNIGLLKIQRLVPEYVTQEAARGDTFHFSLTEKGRQLIEPRLAKSDRWGN